MAQAYRTQLEIPAPADQVWEVLADLERYHEWNPFTPKIETTRELGTPVLIHVSFDGAEPFLQREIIRRWEPGEELRWGMSIGPAWFFRAERFQRVDPIDETRSLYQSEDAFAGLFSPVVERLYGAKVQRGLDATAAALAAKLGAA